MINFFRKLKKRKHQEQLAGGWHLAEDRSLTEEAKNVFAAAMAGYEGPELEPLELLGTQVVAGINYRFRCRTKEESPEEYEIVVYRNLQGQCSVLKKEKV